MKIIIFSESYYPIINGVSVSTDTLSKGLRERGHDVYIVAPHYPDHKDTDKNIIRTNSLKKLTDNFPLPVRLSKRIDNKISSIAPDIVHTQIPFTYGKIATNWCKKNNICHVSVNHTLYVDYMHYCPFVIRKLVQSKLKRYLKTFYNNCDGIITPSNMMKNHLLDYGVNKKIEIIPTGIDYPKEIDREKTRKIKESLNINENDIVLIYLSRIAKEKNIDLLISSFEIIYKQNKNIKLLIVGGGPQEAELKAKANSMDCGKNIIFTGMIPKKDVYSYLACGDIFTFPSYTETQGLAICEAMASGLGVVAVNGGGVPENINNNIDGILCENDKADFANKILYLVNNPNKLKDIQESAIIKAQDFSIDNMIDKYESYYIKKIEEFKSKNNE